MNKLIYILIAILVFLTLLPLFNDTFFQLHDFTHLARLDQMDQAVKEGHFPVRWARDFAFGYGMPLFSFYGPLPSYLMVAFYTLGFSALASLKLFLIFISLLGAYGAYVLSRRFFGRAGALLSAMTFILIPYRALDLYVRGAFNELFSLCLIPWIFHGILQLRDGKRVSWIGITSAFLTMLFMTHNLMTMMFGPVVYLFGLLMVIGAKNKKWYMLSFHLSLVLATLASSFFILPSYLEKHHTQVDALIGGYSYYKYHFLYIRQLFTGIWGYGGSVLGLHDDISFSFGWAAWILATLGGIGWWAKKEHKDDRVFVVFLVALCGAAFFMTTFKSTVVWDSVPLFAYFQFPWRFLSIPAVMMPILAGGTVLLLRGRVQRLLFVGVAAVLLCIFNLRYFTPARLLDNVDALYYTDRNRIQEEMSGILPDYIPSSMKEIQEPFQKPFELEGSDADITMLVDRTHERLVSFRLERPATLLVRIAWFPNWTVYDHTQKIPYTVDERTGFIRVALEPGEHLIAVRLEDTPLRTAANLLSLLGIAGIVGVFAYGRRRGH